MTHQVQCTIVGKDLETSVGDVVVWVGLTEARPWLCFAYLLLLEPAKPATLDMPVVLRANNTKLGPASGGLGQQMGIYPFHFTVMHTFLTPNLEVTGGST